jgi:hypothetical protein
LTFDLPLVTGWNLVSFTAHPSNTDIQNVLSPIAGNYDLVYSWNGATQAWMKYDPLVPYGASLNQIDEQMSFWIRMASDQTLSVAGLTPGTSNIPLHAGWNMVGFPAFANSILPNAFSLHGLGSDPFLVFSYRASDSDHWKLFDSLTPIYSNDLIEMVPGWGYWVKPATSNTWVVEY